MIEACGATLRYLDHGREVFACRDVDLQVRDGEFLGILGPSGSGKSSLLYLLSGLKQPTSGAVRYEGADMAGLPEEERARLRLRQFGFVFQHPFLLGYLSARENVLVAADPDAGSRADDLLSRLGLAEKAHRRPHELSGGERQRVSVARALVAQPRVVFADEPTAALDHANGIQVVEMLRTGRGGGALVMATHDPSMLERADRVVNIVDGALVP